MLQINVDKTVEELLRKYMLSSEDSAKEALVKLLYEKKRKYKIELNQFYRKYDISTPLMLEGKIKNGDVKEHPAWEDLIEIENIISELKDIETDIGKLSVS